MITLGQRIKSIRKQMGMTQEELVGNKITRNQLSMTENGVTNPSMGTLEYIAERLGKPVAYLLNEDVYTLEECKLFITECENDLKTHQFANLIKKIENFISRINDPDSFTYKDEIGKLFHILGIAYSKEKDKRASDTLLKSLDYLNKESSTTYYCKSLLVLSIAAYNNKDYEKTEQYLLQADSILKEITIDSILIKYDILYSLIYLYTRQKEYSKALPYIHQSFKYFKEYQIYHKFGQINMVLAIINMRCKNYSHATMCIDKAVRYFELTDDELNKYRCYRTIGILYRRKLDYHNALKYLEKAIKFFEKINNPTELVYTKAEKLKSLFYTTKNPEELLPEINNLLNHPQTDEGDKTDLHLITTLIHLTQTPENPLHRLHHCETLLQAHPESEFKTYIYQALSKAYETAGDIEKAYDYLSQANAPIIKNFDFEIDIN